MRRALAAAVLTATGCWTAPGPTTTTTPTTPTPPPAGTAPWVAWVTPSTRVETHDLPAASRDGALVVYAVTGVDGARGFPNLSLVARDRDDKVTGELVVLDPNRYDKMSEPEIEAAFATGNAWLAKQHAAHPLAPLRTATNHVTWDTNHLTVTVDDRVRVDRDTPATWRVEPHPVYTNSPDSCENPASLAHAWIAPAAKIAVVEIAYQGTDTCWEPPPQMHVVGW